MEVIDWETWSFSIRQLLFRSSQISTYTLTVRDVLIDSHVAALCPKDHLFLALGQASLGVCHKAELSLETGQVRLEMLHTPTRNRPPTPSLTPLPCPPPPVLYRTLPFLPTTFQAPGCDPGILLLLFCWLSHLIRVTRTRVT